MELIRKTIGECLKECVGKNGNNPAMGSGGQVYTWEMLERLTGYMAVRMLSESIRKGTHVAIWSTNSPNWVIVFLALVRIGAIPVLVNTCCSRQELEQVLRYADVHDVYYGEGYKDLDYKLMVQELKESMGDQVRNWIYIGTDSREQWMTEEEFQENEKEQNALVWLAGYEKLVYAQDTAAMLFTSGTTSRPKGVMLSHYSLLNSALETCAHMKWNREDIMLVTVPLFHCFGITSCLLSGIHTGYKMELIPYFKSRKVMESIENHQCTLLNGVPSMFLAMIRHAAFGEYNLSSLRRGIIAGSAIGAREYMEIRAAIPSLVLHPSYGQTETSPCVSIGDVEDTIEEQATTAGRILKHCETAVFHQGSHKPAACGETGEICVRGYNVMQGYYQMQKETEAVIDQEGWLHTGDLGFIDQNEFLHVTGRIKEMIIRGGENIYPGEIEEAISRYPGIRQVKVIGMPVDVLQEMVVACVIADQGETICQEELLAGLRDVLAYYKVPSYLFEFETFPVTASGKIRLEALRQMVMERMKSVHPTGR